MSKTEIEWDKELNIDTVGRDDSMEDAYHYPYEPTPYCVLERLCEEDWICDKDFVLDYGCGKGRVGFFLNKNIGCAVLGIDFDETMCDAAQKNLVKYVETAEKRIEFLCESAEKYVVKNETVFYFFNPFSVEVLQSVIGKIKKSYYENQREMKLFFYYPSDEYVSYLMMVPELMFVDEVDCWDLFEGKNERERIMIFEMI